MPIYTYKCTECKPEHVFEKIVPHSLTEMYCPLCNALALRDCRPLLTAWRPDKTVRR